MSTHVLKVKEEHNAVRLDVFLTALLPDVPSRSFVKKLIDEGHVRVNEQITKAHHKVTANEEVHVTIPEDFLKPQYIAPENIPLNVFYEDDCLIIINKPTGMMVHPAQGCYTKTLVNALLHYSNKLSDVNEDIRPGIVHRLDQDTSGLMVVAKDNITHTKLAKQFQRNEVKKQYIALVEGNIEFDEGVVNVPIGRHNQFRDKKAVQFTDEAKKSKTFYRVIKRDNNKTLVILYPKTGRTHQLRVHMAYLKHPILGDDKYGKKNSFARLALHAQSIGFKHPKEKRFVQFCSRPPQAFLAAVNL